MGVPVYRTGRSRDEGVGGDEAGGCKVKSRGWAAKVDGFVVGCDSYRGGCDVAERGHERDVVVQAAVGVADGASRGEGLVDADILVTKALGPGGAIAAGQGAGGDGWDASGGVGAVIYLVEGCGGDFDVADRDLAGCILDQGDHIVIAAVVIADSASRGQGLARTDVLVLEGLGKGRSIAGDDGAGGDSREDSGCGVAVVALGIRHGGHGDGALGDGAVGDGVEDDVIVRAAVAVVDGASRGEGLAAAGILVVECLGPGGRITSLERAEGGAWDAAGCGVAVVPLVVGGCGHFEVVLGDRACGVIDEGDSIVVAAVAVADDAASRAEGLAGADVLVVEGLHQGGGIGSDQSARGDLGQNRG